MAKVLAVVGSPRKETTYKLVEAAAEAVREKGVEVELVCLGEYKIKPCQGCSEHCEKAGTCRIRDGMEELYRKMLEADALIIGTPTYFWTVSGTLKNFIDRSLPLYYTGSLKGKLGASISVSEESGQNEALNTISSFYQLHEMKEVGGVSIVRVGPVSEAQLEAARALGRMVAERLLRGS